MPEALGAHNPRIALARDLLTKKGRATQQRYTAEGATLLEEALQARVKLECIFATPHAYETFSAVREGEKSGIATYLVADAVLSKLSDVETPQGIVAVCRAESLAPAELFAQDGIVLVLAGVSDPGNAGTLIRSADAFGVRGVLFGNGSVEPHNPKVVRAAMGSFFRVRVATADVAATHAAARDWEFVGLDAGGGPLSGVRGGPRRALVVGQERRGLGAWRPLCDRLVSIPMQGRAESLNAAVAGSIALFEISREAE